MTLSAWYAVVCSCAKTEETREQDRRRIVNRLIMRQTKL